MNYWKNSIHLQKTAKWISWIACSWVLLWNLYDLFSSSFPPGLFLISAIVALHIWSMIVRKYVFAFRLAGIEIFITTIVLFSALYPPIPGGYAEPLMRFDLAIWVWIFGGGGLATTGWICFKAANKIKHGLHTKNSNPQISRT